MGCSWLSRLTLTLVLLSLVVPSSLASHAKAGVRLDMSIKPAEDGVLVDLAFEAPTRPCNATSCPALELVYVETFYEPSRSLYRVEARGCVVGFQEPKRVKLGGFEASLWSSKRGETARLHVVGRAELHGGTILFGVDVSTQLHGTVTSRLQGYTVVPADVAAENMAVILPLEATLSPKLVNMQLERFNITWLRVREIHVSHTMTRSGSVNITFEALVVIDREKLVEYCRSHGVDPEVVSQLLGLTEAIDYSVEARVQAQTSPSTQESRLVFSMVSTGQGDVEEFARVQHELLLSLARGGIVQLVPTAWWSNTSSWKHKGLGGAGVAELEPLAKLVVLPSTMRLNFTRTSSSKGGSVIVEAVSVRLGVKGVKGDEATREAARLLLALAEALARLGVDVHVDCRVPGASPSPSDVEELLPAARRLLELLRVELPRTRPATGTPYTSSPTPSTASTVSKPAAAAGERVTVTVTATRTVERTITQTSLVTMVVTATTTVTRTPQQGAQLGWAATALAFLLGVAVGAAVCYARWGRS